MSEASISGDLTFVSFAHRETEPFELVFQYLKFLCARARVCVCVFEPLPK